MIIAAAAAPLAGVARPSGSLISVGDTDRSFGTNVAIEAAYIVRRIGDLLSVQKS